MPPSEHDLSDDEGVGENSRTSGFTRGILRNVDAVRARTTLVRTRNALGPMWLTIKRVVSSVDWGGAGRLVLPGECPC
jgi:hypothetical protein